METPVINRSIQTIKFVGKGVFLIFIFIQLFFISLIKIKSIILQLDGLTKRAKHVSTFKY